MLIAHIAHGLVNSAIDTGISFNDVIVKKFKQIMWQNINTVFVNCQVKCISLRSAYVTSVTVFTLPFFLSTLLISSSHGSETDLAHIHTPQIQSHALWFMLWYRKDYERVTKRLVNSYIKGLNLERVKKRKFSNKFPYYLK